MSFTNKNYFMLSSQNIRYLLAFFIFSTIYCCTNKRKTLPESYLRGYVEGIDKNSPVVSFKKRYMKYDSLMAYAGQENFDIEEQLIRVLNDSLQWSSEYSEEFIFNKNRITTKLSPKNKGGTLAEYYYTENEYLDSIAYIAAHSGLINEAIIFTYNKDTTTCTAKHYSIRWIDTKTHRAINTQINPNLDYNLENDTLNTLVRTHTYSSGLKGTKLVSTFYEAGKIKEVKVIEKDTINDIKYSLRIKGDNIADVDKARITQTNLSITKYTYRGKVFVREEFRPLKESYLKELADCNNSLSSFDFSNDNAFKKINEEKSFLDTIGVTEKNLKSKKVTRVKFDKRYTSDKNGNEIIEYLDKYENIAIEYRIIGATGKIEGFFLRNYKYKE